MGHEYCIRDPIESCTDRPRPKLNKRLIIAQMLFRGYLFRPFSSLIWTARMYGGVSQTFLWSKFNELVRTRFVRLGRPQPISIVEFCLLLGI